MHQVSYFESPLVVCFLISVMHSFPMQGMTMKPLSSAARAWQFDAVSSVGDGTAWLSGLLSKAKARRLLCQLVVTMISRIVLGFARIFCHK